MQTLEPLLAEHPFFQGLDPRYIEILSGCASNAKFDGGEYIFHEDEEADRFFLIRHGKVALEIYVPSGPHTIATLGEGEVLGWSWLVSPYRWRFDARAVELVRATVLDGKCLRSKCDDDPALGYELMKRFVHIVEQRLQATRYQLLDMYGVHRV